MEKSIPEQNIEIFTFGRTRSGKTTFCNNLVHYLREGNLDKIEPSSFCSIFSDTKIPTRRSVLCGSHIISIEDTRGLFEVVEIGKNKMDNSDILKENLNFFPKKNGWKKIAFFTLSLYEGVNEEDIKSIESYIDIINDDEFHCAILLTRSEKFTCETMNRLIEELKIILKRNKKLDISKFQFFRTGALDHCNARFEQSKKIIIANVENMMKNIVEFITN